MTSHILYTELRSIAQQPLLWYDINAFNKAIGAIVVSTRKVAAFASTYGVEAEEVAIKPKIFNISLVLLISGQQKVV